MNLERQSALKSEKRQFYEHYLKNKKFPDILMIMQPLKNICVIAALQFYCLLHLLSSNSFLRNFSTFIVL